MSFDWEERRGGPAAWGSRLARAEELALSVPAAAAPLRLLGAVVRYQAGAVVAWEAVAAGADERRAAGRYPLLDLGAAAHPVVTGIPTAVAAVAAGDVLPEPLAAAGEELAGAGELERMAVVETWLDDAQAVDPRLGFWVGVAAGPVLEPARAAVEGPGREEWAGRACPACGGLPQVSVIAPESGAFMEGSPRSLVCGRCAGWWGFARATCAWCGEDDPRKLAPFVTESSGTPRAPGGRTARIDACESCASYVKTFDLRQPGGAAVVPLVDDVATVGLDLWAREQGLERPVVSLAGV